MIVALATINPPLSLGREKYQLSYGPIEIDHKTRCRDQHTRDHIDMLLRKVLDWRLASSPTDETGDEEKPI